MMSDTFLRSQSDVSSPKGTSPNTALLCYQYFVPTGLELKPRAIDGKMSPWVKYW
jgi:hypothetical protein